MLHLVIYYVYWKERSGVEGGGDGRLWYDMNVCDIVVIHHCQPPLKEIVSEYQVK